MHARWGPEPHPVRFPRRAAQRAQTRTRILHAARDLVAEDGLWGATLERVARRASTSKGSIIFHFGSKTALVAALLHDDARLAATAFFAAWTSLRGKIGTARLIEALRRVLSGTAVAEAVRWSCVSGTKERKVLESVSSPLLEVIESAVGDLPGESSVSRRVRRALALMLLAVAVFGENLPGLRLRALGEWMDRGVLSFT